MHMSLISQSCCHYRLHEKINQGSYGYIFNANSQLDPSKPLIIKILKESEESAQIKEIEHLTSVKLNKVDGLSEIIDYGQLDSIVSTKLKVPLHTRFIVMPKLETSIKDLIFSQDCQIMVKDVLKMGIRLIKILEGLHSIGLCHLDIKPDNIMIRNPNNNGQQKEIVLIDLGQAQSFIDQESGKHMPDLEHVNFQGNYIFASKYIIQGHSPSRRDDII